MNPAGEITISGMIGNYTADVQVKCRNSQPPYTLSIEPQMTYHYYLPGKNYRRIAYIPWKMPSQLFL